MMGCENKVENDVDSICRDCVWKLHVELCKLSGITDAEAVRIAWERGDEPNPN